MGLAPATHQIVEASRDLVGFSITWSWQLLLVLAVAWLALRFDRSHSATTRYRVWLIALLVSSVLPLLSAICKSLPGPPLPLLLPAVGTDAIPTVSTTGMPVTEFSWTSLFWPALLLFWAAGAAVQLLRLSASFLKLRAIRRFDSSATNATCASDLSHPEPGFAQAAGRPVPIVYSARVRSPGLTGLLRPVILLPADLASWTSADERASILNHELAHITRRDHLASLFQSILNSLFFFHPMLRYACNQLSLERELACDERVLRLGTEPRTYAESILKAAERTFITDTVHQTAAFASKRKLERRIDMILDPNRAPFSLRQWPFLMLPLILLGIITWIVMPAASGRPGAAIPPTSSHRGQSQAPETVDRQTVFIDTVQRGNLLRKVRALGNLKETDGNLLAALQVPEIMIVAVELGQPVAVDTRIGVVPGKVYRIHSRGTKGVVRVDVILDGQLPEGAGNGLAVDGTIEIGRLDDVLYIGRPVNGSQDSNVSLFKLAEDGLTATRVDVRLGKASVNSIQVVTGLNEGDRVIISNMSAYDDTNKIIFK